MSREVIIPLQTAVLLLVLAQFCPHVHAAQQGELRLNNAADVPSSAKPLANLPLPAASKSAVSADISKHEYDDAERILINAIHKNSKSPQLLTFLGGVYFLAGSYLECAAAMKKAELLAPLPDPDRFTLAMAYIVLGHSDWAKPEIERLIELEPRNALYYYWLSRVDYDLRFYAKGVAAGERAVALKPDFVRAYDSVGLCKEALGHYKDAIQTYQKAADRNLHAVPPSPWPPLELGTLLLRLHRFAEAKEQIEKSLSIDPRFPEAHYQLGLWFEDNGKDTEAVSEFNKAAALQPNFARPHYALARLYGRLGKAKLAQAETAQFHKIRAKQKELGIR